MFLPATRDEMKKLGWKSLDVIIVTGDAYIDSPFAGAAVIGKYLLAAGFRVGIIAQPSTAPGAADIERLGEPELYWGVTAGSVDSMVANYTPLKKPRRSDDMTPGGTNGRRPDRATIAYSNLIRRHFKNTRPIVLGGVEASLRRIAHYDYWSDSVRRSVLFDAKADYLVYGMGERPARDLARCLRSGHDPRLIKGICHISKEIPDGFLELPSFEEASADRAKFIDMFNAFYENSDPLTASGLVQRHGDRFLVQNPPQANMTEEELDAVYDLDYEREAHPRDAGAGRIAALDTIRFSITTHRGCYGECNFCAIAVHQGTTVVSRSAASIVAEAEKIARMKDFKGYITDLGGPSANMYGIECAKKVSRGRCADRRCLFPEKCPAMKISHERQIELLKKVAAVPGVKKVFVGSGVRHDMVFEDAEFGRSYMERLVRFHVSGQLKLAPEHSEEAVLRAMGKPGTKHLKQFREEFFKISERAGKKQFLTYYLMAAHPGCGEKEMKKLRDFVVRELGARPEQVQIFTPTPSTYSTLMYYTGMDPFTEKRVYVDRSHEGRQRQKEIITGLKPGVFARKK